jgi:deoxyribonuclease-4
MVRAADRAAEIGASAIQVFTDNPTSWRRRPGLPRELPAFRDRLAAHGIDRIAVHAPYLVNLAGSDGELRERTIEVMVNELAVAHAYGARWLNVHVGSHRGDGVAAGTGRVASAVREILDRVGDEAPGVELVLENGPGSGFGLGTSMEELAGLDRAIADAGVPRDRFGFCLDTAHLWGAGYPLQTAVGVDGTIAAFDELVGLKRLRLIHLNDGAGRIGAPGLARIMLHDRLADTVYLLETPGMDEGWDGVNMARARDLATGRRLDDLPAAAFHTRSAKGRSAPADDEPAGAA